SPSASDISRARDMDRIGGNVSGMTRCLSLSATAATAARGGALFRTAAVARLVAVALDADDGEDQDGPHAAVRRADHAWAQPPRGGICRKIDDGPHARSLWLSLSETRRHVN